MKLFTGAFLFLLFISLGCAQHSIDDALKKYNEQSVPYITVEDLAKGKVLVLLDARAKEEFEVSKIKNAIWVGYEKFDEHAVLSKIGDMDTEIVVYCSIGVRSEDIAEKLKELGYTRVQNLYGGVFKWKNQGYF